MEKELNIPKRHLVFSASGSVSGKRITLKANSGKPFAHDYWRKLALDLGGMKIQKNRLPILLSHDTSKPIGFFDRHDVHVNGGLHVNGTLVDSSHAREFSKIVSEGVPFEASLRGAPVSIQKVNDGEETEVNGYEFTGPGHIWRSWNLMEASPCIFGRDSDTSTDLFTFAGSNDLVSLQLETWDEDEKIATELFMAGQGRHLSGVENISPEDEKLADELFKASGWNWWDRT